MALSCHFVMPTASSYLGSFIFLAMANVLLAVAGVLAHFLRRSAPLWPLQWAVALLLGMAPFVLDGYLEAAGAYSLFGSGVIMMCRFIAGSMSFLGTLRVIEALGGGAPPDTVQDLPSWIKYLTSVDSRRGPDLRGMKAPPGALRSAVRRFLSRMLLLSVAFSVLAAGNDGQYRPLASTSAGLESAVASAMVSWVDNWIGSLCIYLFLALIIDLGGVLLILTQGLEPITAFNNPMLGSRSPTDMWARRWNMQMHGVLKRAFFLPLVKRGTPKQLAGFATFVASAAYHEVQFRLSFPRTYTWGQGSIFFLVQGLICIAENALYCAAPRIGDSLPVPVKVLLTTLLMIMTSELFVSIWRVGGMFDAIGTIITTMNCTS